MQAEHITLRDVPGIRVGHWTDARAATGCTVVLIEGGLGGRGNASYATSTNRAPRQTALPIAPTPHSTPVTCGAVAASLKRMCNADPFNENAAPLPVRKIP